VTATAAAAVGLAVVVFAAVALVVLADWLDE
jgi:hypothetical protein